MRPVCIALRALVKDVAPGAFEVVRLGDVAATYGVGPQKQDYPR